MALATTLLDAAQEYLHDDGTIWSRAELLDYLNDGYRRMLHDSEAVRQLDVLTTPPRIHAAYTSAWERQYLPDQVAQWTWNTTGYTTALRWEVEHLLGSTPTDSDDAVTQPWERIYGDDTGKPDHYAFPDDCDTPVRLTYDAARMVSEPLHTLDQVSDRWETNTGTPVYRTGGTLPESFFGLSPRVTADNQGYGFTGTLGTVGEISGDQTYTITQQQGPAIAYSVTSEADTTNTNVAGLGKKITTDTATTAEYQVLQSWEVQQVEGDTPTAGATYVPTHVWETLLVGLTEWTALAGIGTPVSLTGSSQYYATTDSLGTICAAASSDDNLLIDYTVAPETLAETDETDLLPDACDKYLRAYILHRAFARDGDGKQSLLAAFFGQRFQQGVSMLKRMGHFASIARNYQQDRVGPAERRPGRVRLPSTYPRVGSWR